MYVHINPRAYRTAVHAPYKPTSNQLRSGISFMICHTIRKAYHDMRYVW